MSDFTEEQALKMEKAADHFFVKLEDNIYGVRFNGFKLRDLKDDKVYHKSSEEMSQDYEMIMSNPNLTDAEKEKYQNFYSCFITPKTRIS